MIVMKYDDWKAKGRELFGEPKDWQFLCPACGRRQSIAAAVKSLGITEKEASGFVYSSCEGRRDASVGCNWTLGGLFRIHALEIDEEGEPKNVPAFIFDGMQDDAGIDHTPLYMPRECEATEERKHCDKKESA